MNTWVVSRVIIFFSLGKIMLHQITLCTCYFTSVQMYLQGEFLDVGLLGQECTIYNFDRQHLHNLHRSYAKQHTHFLWETPYSLTNTVLPAFGFFSNLKNEYLRAVLTGIYLHETPVELDAQFLNILLIVMISLHYLTSQGMNHVKCLAFVVYLNFPCGRRCL